MDLRDQLQETLGSSYQLERELRAGGMARVFVAHEARLHRSVVVKVMSLELATGVSTERFEREIQLAASLQQANIVPVLSAGDVNGVPYYTMPYVVGESLRTLLATRGRLPISEAVGILRDVARALSYAHAHGVVHRDIKPDNVLLSHGAAVVTDFGIAKALAAAGSQAVDRPEGRTDPVTLTQAGSIIGTPAYMSPEQIAGGSAIDAHTDLYALGCMAYELLTGHPPFAGMPLERMLAAHLSELPVPVGEVRPDTPSSLASLVTCCLAKHPTDRPPSAMDVLTALDSVGSQSAGHEAMVTPPRPSLSRRLITVASVAAFIAVLVLASAWWRGRSAFAAHIDRSMAVLPLSNLSGDPANDYFGEGLAEEITIALGKAGLRVIGRGSARTLVGRGLDGPAIARQLGVGSALQGAVQRSGDQLRITMSLVSASDSLMWTDTYNRNIKDVFAVQDEIARSVASQLRITLTGAGLTLARKPTDDVEANGLYMQGLYAWKRRSAVTLNQAIGRFEQAVQRDPKYAEAYAGIGMAYVVLPVYADVPTDSMLSLAVIAARHALAIDSTLPEAHAVIGYANATRFQNAAAETSFAKAIALDSLFATAHFWRSILLGHTGRADAAVREAERASALDPASPVIVGMKGRLLYNARQFAAADSAERVALAFDTTFDINLLTQATILIQQPDGIGEAIRILEAMRDLPNVRSSEKLGLLAYAYARADRNAEARATLARLPRDTSVSAGGMVAAALDALGDRDDAVSMFERAVAQHDPWILIHGRSAPFDGLRRDPRLTSLFATIEKPD